MPQKIGRVLVDAVRARPVQLVLAVAAGEESHAQRPRAPRAASRSHTLSPTTTESSIGTPSRSAAARNRSGSGLAWLDLVAGDDRHVGADAERFERRPGALDPAAGGDRPGHAGTGEIGEQVARAGQRPDLIRPGRRTPRRAAVEQAGGLLAVSRRGRSRAGCALAISPPLMPMRRWMRPDGQLDARRPPSPRARPARAGRRCRPACRRDRTGRRASGIRWWRPWLECGRRVRL